MYTQRVVISENQHLSRTLSIMTVPSLWFKAAALSNNVIYTEIRCKQHKQAMPRARQHFFDHKSETFQACDTRLPHCGDNLIFTRSSAVSKCKFGKVHVPTACCDQWKAAAKRSFHHDGARLVSRLSHCGNNVIFTRFSAQTTQASNAQSTATSVWPQEQDIASIKATATTLVKSIFFVGRYAFERLKSGVYNRCNRFHLCLDFAAPVFFSICNLQLVVFAPAQQSIPVLQHSR